MMVLLIVEEFVVCISKKIKLTWEEIIKEIRIKPEFKQLVQDAYLGDDLSENVNQFSNGLEFKETLKIIQDAGFFTGSHVLDIGAGNGIATISFARKGFKVTALEPDLSETIGAGAIQWLVKNESLENVQLLTTTAENIKSTQAIYEIVYIRQAVHHAANLNQFIANAVASLKSGGLYLATRDHVIYNENDKQWFLESHPLHKFYGGENAFTLIEYLDAMKKAGLKEIQYFSYYESPLNFLPVSPDTIRKKIKSREDLIDHSLRSKFGPLAKNKWLKKMYTKRVNRKLGLVLDESLVPGRPYTFIGIKP